MYDVQRVKFDWDLYDFNATEDYEWFFKLPRTLEQQKKHANINCSNNISVMLFI